MPENAVNSDMASASPPSALLTRYIVHNADYAWETIAATEGQLADHQINMALQALDFALLSKSTWSQARKLLLALAPFMEQQGYYALWQRFLELGIAFSKEMEDQETEMNLRYHLGLLWQYRAHYQEAITQHEIALTLAQQLDSLIWQARLYSRLASHWRHLRQWDQAESMLAQAQARLLPDDAEDLGYFSLIRGAIYLDKRSWQQAYEWFQKSLSWWQKSGKKQQIAKALANLGLVARRLHLIPEAESHLRQAIQIFDELGEMRLSAMASMNLGALLADYGRAPEGLTYLRRAEKFFRQTQDPMRLAMTTTNMGRAYYDMEAWEDAIRALQRGRELWEEVGNLPRVLNVLAGLAAAYARFGEIAQARTITQQGRNLLHEINNEEERNFLQDAFAEVEKITLLAQKENRDRH